MNGFAQPVDCIRPPSGLVGWWTADATADDFLGLNPGQLVGDVRYEEGQLEQAFSMHGGVDAVKILASPALQVGLGPGLTIEAWINPANLSVRSPLVEWNRGGTNFIEWGLHFYVLKPGDFALGPGSLFANLAEPNGTPHYIMTPPGTVVSNVWQHVALTYNKASGEARLYRNGAAVTITNLGSFTPETTYDLFLGRRPAGDGVGSYVGLLDEVAIYKRALTPGELQANYESLLGMCKDPLPPLIIIPPQDQTIWSGDNVVFNVVAGGAQPLSYQWTLDGAELPGETEPTLSLANVQPEQAGDYSVIITNDVGSLTSRVASLVVRPVPDCLPPPRGLVAWWPGEANSDDMLGLNPGTSQGGVTFIGGQVGKAFSMHGGNDAIRIAASPVLDVGTGDGLTIESWINPGNLSLRSPLVEWNHGGTNLVEWGVHFHVLRPGDFSLGPGSLFANLAESNGTPHYIMTAAATISSNLWQHVALTYDKTSGQARLYLNGNTVAATNLGTFTPATAYDLYLGRRPAGTGIGSYVGMLDEVSIYNRALAQPEIDAAYHSSVAGKCKTPLPPLIVIEPQDRSVFSGDTARFTTVAGGAGPFSYQWRFNGDALLGQNAAALSLSNVQESQVGRYSVIVSSDVGSVTSRLATLTVNLVPPCELVPPGLVGWWPLDGNVTDLVGVSPGTLQANASFAPGMSGGCIVMHGGQDAIKVPASRVLNVGGGAGLTIEAWINPANLSARSPLVEWNRGGTNFTEWGVHFYVLRPGDFGLGAGSLFANVAESDGTPHYIMTPAGAISSNTWQHVALTYDKLSGQARLYRNGQIATNANLGTFTPETSYDLYFGRRPAGDGVGSYIGLLDEVGIYNRALDQTEIQASYNSGISGKCKEAVPPLILVQPVDQAVVAGRTVTFSVIAGGALPLHYQWSQDEVELTGATNATLTLSNVQIYHEGDYSVTVTSDSGTVGSREATLELLPRPPETPPPAGLVGWWAGEGNAGDSTGLNPGRLLGEGLKFAAAKVEQGFVINGGQDGVKISASPSLEVGAGPGFTIEAWINPSKLSLRGPIVEWNRGGTNFIEWGVHLFVLKPGDFGLGEGSLYANLAEANGTAHTIHSAPGVIVANTWQHVALTYEKSLGRARLFRNGQVVADANLGTFTPETTYHLYLGRRPAGDGAGSFVGMLDEVAIYQRGLPREEIQAIYNAALLGKTQGPPGLDDLVSTVRTSTASPFREALLTILDRVRASFARSNPMAEVNQLWEFERFLRDELLEEDSDLAQALFQSAEDLIQTIDPTGEIRDALAVPRVVDCQSVVLLPNGRVRLKVVGEPGALYSIQCSTDLQSWTELGVAGELPAGCFIFDDITANGSPFRFYRVLVGQ